MPVGTYKYVEHMLEKKVEEIARSAKNSCDALDEERQSLWAVLRLSLSQHWIIGFNYVIPQISELQLKKLIIFCGMF